MPVRFRDGEKQHIPRENAVCNSLFHSRQVLFFYWVMKISRYASVIVFVILCLAFVMAVNFSAPGLPNRLATHFDASGNPNGWMTKTAYVPFMSLMGVALPVFTIGLTALSRFMPDWAIHLPHKDYWLSSEQRPATNAFLLRHAFWFGCLILMLMGGAHYLTVRANQSTPVHMPGTDFAILMGAFLTGTVIWVIILFRRFRTPG